MNRRTYYDLILGKGYWYWTQDRGWFRAAVEDFSEEQGIFALFITGFANTLASQESSIRGFVPEITFFRNKSRPRVGETVRREKALDFSGCNSRPGTGSLHPVATETTAEVTKRSELSV